MSSSDNEYHFIVLDEKIHKLAPKTWKTGTGDVSEKHSQTPQAFQHYSHLMVLFFAVTIVFSIYKSIFKTSKSNRYHRKG